MALGAVKIDKQAINPTYFALPNPNLDEYIHNFKRPLAYNVFSCLAGEQEFASEALASP